MTRCSLRLFAHCIVPLLIGAALAGGAAAQVYKCTDGAGKTAYQSQPCPAATRGAAVDVRSAVPAPPPVSSADVPTVQDTRRAMVASCVGDVSQAEPAVARVAAQQPARFRAYCECFADTVLADPAKLRELGQRNDRAGVERLQLQAGASCAARLKLP